MAGMGSGNSVQMDNSTKGGDAKTGDLTTGAKTINFNAPAKALTDSTFGKGLVIAGGFALFVLTLAWLKKK